MEENVTAEGTHNWTRDWPRRSGGDGKDTRQDGKEQNGRTSKDMKIQNQRK
jgi:hypothetical protein